jgi:redox-sensitive bicupin YhaK (pirin superfamily)
MRAGKGVWHTGSFEPGPVAFFQLWLALPPDLENAASSSQYLLPGEIPQVGPARVLLGAYGNAQSPIDAPPVIYLEVKLRDGERWSFHPGTGHDVAWVAVHQGEILAAEPIHRGEIAVFEPSTSPIDLVARGGAAFVIGSAIKHPYDLVLGSYSVHTSAKALERGEAEIRKIAGGLRESGVLGR